jgi:hypothetical protein
MAAGRERREVTGNNGGDAEAHAHPLRSALPSPTSERRGEKEAA